MQQQRLLAAANGRRSLARSGQDILSLLLWIVRAVMSTRDIRLFAKKLSPLARKICLFRFVAFYRIRLILSTFSQAHISQAFAPCGRSKTGLPRSLQRIGHKVQSSGVKHRGEASRFRGLVLSYRPIRHILVVIGHYTKNSWNRVTIPFILRACALLSVPT